MDSAHLQISTAWAVVPQTARLALIPSSAPLNNAPRPLPKSMVVLLTQTQPLALLVFLENNWLETLATQFPSPTVLQYPATSVLLAPMVWGQPLTESLVPPQLVPPQTVPFVPLAPTWRCAFPVRLDTLWTTLHWLACQRRPPTVKLKVPLLALNVNWDTNIRIIPAWNRLYRPVLDSWLPSAPSLDFFSDN